MTMILTVQLTFECKWQTFHGHQVTSADISNRGQISFYGHIYYYIFIIIIIIIIILFKQ